MTAFKTWQTKIDGLAYLINLTHKKINKVFLSGL